MQLPNWQFTIVRVLYRGFPSKLHHDVPSWVEDGVLFHIRIAVDRQAQQRSLAETDTGGVDARFREILSRKRAVVHHVISFDARSFAHARCIL